MYLRRSTAHTFRLGMFVDEIDGKTQENSLTITYADVLLSKAGGVFAAKNDTTNLTGTGANGHYTCVLDATDTGTLGHMRILCHVAGALPVWRDFLVVPAAVYDELVAGTEPEVGPGATKKTVLIEVGGVPQDGVEVWVTTDSAGTAVVAGTLVTGASGEVDFWLDSGTYYVWAQKGGVNFAEGTVLVV